MDNLGKIKERTSAMSAEASHSRAGDAVAEDLRQELDSLREQLFRELGEMQFKVARTTTQPMKTKIVATLQVTAQSEADPQGGASKACSQGGDEEAFIKDTWVRVDKGTLRPSVRHCPP